MSAETRRAGRSIGLAGIVLIALSSLTIADDTAGEEAKRLEGTWKIVSLTADGTEAPPDSFRGGRWTIGGGEILITGPEAGKVSFKVDPGRSPKAIDMTAVDGPSRGKMFPCIYKLEGQRLTICFPQGRQESQDLTRPGEFDGGKSRSLIVFERSRDE